MYNIVPFVCGSLENYASKPCRKKGMNLACNHKHVVIQGESHVLTQAVHEFFFLEVKNDLSVGDRYCRSKHKNETSVMVLQTNFST